MLVLEKEKFPRFHIGESLLPYNRILFEQMGVLPKLEAAGLFKKWGAQFHIGNGTKTLKLVFRRGKFTKEPGAFQESMRLCVTGWMSHDDEIKSYRAWRRTKGGR